MILIIINIYIYLKTSVVKSKTQGEHKQSIGEHKEAKRCKRKSVSSLERHNVSPCFTGSSQVDKITNRMGTLNCSSCFNVLCAYKATFLARSHRK